MNSDSTVLIVDDEEVIRETLGRLLASEGYTLAFASNGEEALAKAKELTPDLILLDILMPVMDGFVACQRLRADPLLVEVPVVMVTALDDHSSRLRGIEAGADDFISKPFDEIELQAKVRTITRLNRYRKLLLERNQRQQAEEALRAFSQRLQATFDAMSDSVCLLDLNGIILQCNEATTKLLGRPHDEILGRTWWELVHGTSKPSGGCPIVRMLEARHREALVFPMDDRWFEVTADPVLDDEGGDLIGVVHIMADITERKRAEESLQESRARLEVLSRRLVEAQEAERRRIARELHDEVGQALTVIKINLQTVQRALDTPALKPHLEESIGIVERALEQVRGLSLDLRPSLLDDLGLVPALRWYVDRQAQQAGFSAHFIADPLEERLPPHLEVACFRIAQEVLTNAMRHAQAQRVSLELRRREGQLHLVARDDGVGFDVSAALAGAARGLSLGLLGMQERVHLVGGRMEIQSAPGRGTEVRVCFPLTLPAFPEKRNGEGERWS